MSEDPRFLRSREAILAAARVLLRDEGPSAVTHQRVARAAAIGRATVYRHWSGPHDLLLAVMATADLPFFQDPTTPVRPWLHQQLRRLADELTLPEVTAAALTLLQQAQWNPQLAQQREHFLAAITQRLDAALLLAVDTGELRARSHLSDATALLVGPILFRTTAQSSTASDELLNHLLHTVGTWAPQPPRHHRPPQ